MVHHLCRTILHCVVSTAECVYSARQHFDSLRPFPNYLHVYATFPNPEAARSKAWVCGLFFAGTAGSSPAGTWISLVNFLCCQVEVSARGQSLVQRSLPTVSVIVKPQQWGGPIPTESVNLGRNIPTYWWSVAYFSRLLLFQIIRCSIEWDNGILLNKKCLFGSIITIIFP
jgi:hypothetical protein